MKTLLIIFGSSILFYMLIGIGVGIVMAKAFGGEISFSTLWRFAFMWPLYFIR